MRIIAEFSKNRSPTFDNRIRESFRQVRPFSIRLTLEYSYFYSDTDDSSRRESNNTVDMFGIFGTSGDADTTSGGKENTKITY